MIKFYEMEINYFMFDLKKARKMLTDGGLLDTFKKVMRLQIPKWESSQEIAGLENDFFYNRFDQEIFRIDDISDQTSELLAYSRDVQDLKRAGLDMNPILKDFYKRKNLRSNLRKMRARRRLRFIGRVRGQRGRGLKSKQSAGMGGSFGRSANSRSANFYDFKVYSGHNGTSWDPKNVFFALKNLTNRPKSCFPRIQKKSNIKKLGSYSVKDVSKEPTIDHENLVISPNSPEMRNGGNRVFVVRRAASLDYRCNYSRSCPFLDIDEQAQYRYAVRKYLRDEKRDPDFDPKIGQKSHNNEARPPWRTFKTADDPAFNLVINYMAPTEPGFVSDQLEMLDSAEKFKHAKEFERSSAVDQGAGPVVLNLNFKDLGEI